MVKLVGLTGGVGSGKSTVAAMLGSLGAAVIDADEAARAVVEPGTDGYAAVVAAFGQEVVALTGGLDRARLGQIVFADPEARSRLNAILHPAVRDWMAARTTEAIDRGVEVVVQDVPLLFENGLESLYSMVILVYVPAELQVARLIEGRGFTEQQARAVIAAQMPIEDKRGRAGIVIDNSGSREETERQVDAAWQTLRA